MATHLDLILANPWKTLLCIYEILALLLITLISRILLPFVPRVVDLRTEIARDFIGPGLTIFWEILYKAPPGLDPKRYRVADIGGVPSVVIPPHAALAGGPLDLQRKNLVILFAHGGGYLFGEPLQYISTYERWVQNAAQQGIDLTIVSVDYRALSSSIYGMFSLIDCYKIAPERIILSGDSAGGGLSAMTAIHLRNHKISPPLGLVLISPWLDLSAQKTRYSPGQHTDFPINYSTSVDSQTRAFIPDGMSNDDPRVSPIFDDLHDLPQHLVFAGSAEVLLSDSEDWVKKAREAGNKVDYVCEPGQMHVYPMGFPFAGSTVTAKADNQLFKFLHKLIASRDEKF
ncbi:hypothetical protein B7463_g10332, partial [Scytalidium lignicola]